MIIFFFFGGGILIALGVILMVMLALGGTFAVWLLEHALTIGILLLVLHIFYTISTVYSLQNNTGSFFGSLILSALHSIPPIFVVTTGYQYLLIEIKKSGTVSGLIDIAVCWGIYLLADRIWNKLVIKGHAQGFGSTLLTLLHFAVSCFFIVAFSTYQ